MPKRRFVADQGVFHAESYKDGWKEGCEDALRLSLGEPIPHGGAPYDGPPCPPEFHAWVQKALHKLETA